MIRLQQQRLTFCVVGVWVHLIQWELMSFVIFLLVPVSGESVDTRLVLQNAVDVAHMHTVVETVMSARDAVII